MAKFQDLYFLTCSSNLKVCPSLRSFIMDSDDDSSLSYDAMDAVSALGLEEGLTDEQNGTQTAETTPESEREAIKRVDKV